MKRLITNLLGFVLAVSPLLAGNTVGIGSFSIYAGDTLRVPVAITKEVAFASVMMDVYLPDGLGIDRIELSGLQATSTRISTAQQPNGSTRIVAYSLDNKLFNGNEGNVLDVVFWAKEATAAGNYQVDLRNIVLTSAAGTDYPVATISTTVTINRYASTVQTPTLSYSNQTLTVGNVPEGAIIRYTTDGSTPSRYSNLSSGQIAVLENGTVRVMMTKAGMNSSSEAAFTVTNANVVKPVITVTGDSIFTIASATPDAVIVYTMDGTVPTTESFVYRHPIKFDGNYIINAIAMKRGNSNSHMASDTVISYVVKKPIIFVDHNKLCYISCVTPYSTVYYTWDGSTPTSSSTKYTGVFSLDGNGTLKAVGVKPRYYDSAPDSVVIASFTVIDPIIELLPDNYCQITTATSGASIYYTLDGTQPTASSTLYSGKFELTGNGLLKTIALKNRYFDSQVTTSSITTFKVSSPTIHYPEASVFTLNCSTPSATIYYTMDGTTPTRTSQVYSGPIHITTPYEVKAFAVKDRYYDSETSSFQVALSGNRLQVENFYIYSGDEQSVDLTLFNDSAFTSFVVDLYLPEGVSLINDSLFYAGRQLDHVLLSAPQSNGAIRIMGYSMGNRTFTGSSGSLLHLGLRANDYLATGTYKLWLKNIFFTSDDVKDHPLPDFSADITIKRYDYTVETPVFAYSNDTLTITSATEGATILYTTNGTTPNRNSTPYSDPLLMTENCVVKALAVKEKYNISATDSISIHNFKVDTLVLTAFDKMMPYEMRCVLECATPDAAIHYTLDDSTPTKDSPLYTDTLRLTENCVLRAIALRKNWYDSDILMQEFTNFIVSQPVITLYNKLLFITCSTKNATIHYTLDGTTPTVDSPMYTDSVFLTGNCEIKAIGIRNHYINSTIAYDVFGSYRTERPVIQLVGNKTRCVLTCATEGSSIHYTVDGSTPTTSSALYTDTFQLAQNCLIQAIAVRYLYKNSEVTRQSVLYYGNAIHTDTLPTSAGEVIPVTIAMTNDSAFTAFTADLYLPKGFTLLEPSLQLGVRKTTAHTLITSPLPDGSLRILSYSPTNEPFAGHSGTLLSFNLHVSDTLSAGIHAVKLATIALTSITGNDCLLEDATVNIEVEGYANTVEKPIIAYVNDTLIINCASTDAVIHYTTDGSAPTRNDAIYSEPVKVVYNGVYKARAFKEEYNRSLIDSVTINDRQVAEPVITYQKGKLWITCQTNGSKIYYTTDGSQPTDKSTLYTVPVTLSANCEVKAFAACPKMHDSEVGRYLVYKIGNYIEIADFTLSPTDKQTLAIKLDNNKAFTAFVMELYVPKGFVITKLDSLHLDVSLSGRKSSSHSLSYNATSDSTLRIMAYSPSNVPFSGLEGDLVRLSLQTTNTPIGKYRFSLKNTYFTTPEGVEEKFSDSEAFGYISTLVAEPEIAVEDTLVAIDCPTLGASVYYTLDGTTPTSNDLLYTGRFSPGGNCLVKAIAVKEFCTDSKVVSAWITTFTTKTPTIQLVENWATLTCATSGARVFYTLDGTTPSTNSTLYTDAIYFNPVKTDTLKAIAVREKYNPSETSTYIFNPLYAIGDANGDRAVNVTDVATVIYRIGGNDSLRFIREAADVNTDDTIDVADVVGIVSALTGQTKLASSITNRSTLEVVNRLTANLTLEEVQLVPGEEKSIPVYVSNCQQFTAFQFNLSVPEGIRLVSVSLNSKAVAGSHNLMTFDKGDGNTLALAYSTRNAPFKNVSEPIAYVTLKADESLTTGEYSLSATNLLFVNAAMDKHLLENSSTRIVVSAATSIKKVASDDVQSVTYYSMSGLLLDKPGDGITLVKTVYKNGQVKVTKYLKPEE